MCGHRSSEPTTDGGSTPRPVQRSVARRTLWCTASPVGFRLTRRSRHPALAKAGRTRRSSGRSRGSRTVRNSPRPGIFQL
jgi:hypothetical protein